MSEVIEDYIRRNSGMREADAFESFLQQDRIRAWVGADDARRERLRREFTRVWASLHPPATASRQATTTREVRREPEQPVSIEVRKVQPKLPEPRAVEDEAVPHVRPTTPPKKLQVICPTCGKYDVFSKGGVIECRTCTHKYENMLDLIPARAVGPFTFLFGEGYKGWLVAVGIVLGLVALYEVLRWV